MSRRPAYRDYPLAEWDTGHAHIVIYAHRLRVSPQRDGTRKIVCCEDGSFPGQPDCDFAATAPGREAREIADAHSIYTHVTGGVECGHTHCAGCEAIKRQRRRLSPPEDVADQR